MALDGINKNKQDNDEKEEKVTKIKNLADLQRLKLEKLMKNPDKPVIIPEKPKSKSIPPVPDFVRNVMGSSAGAGSGEFHVYRHLRRKEYARQKFIKEMSERERLELEYQIKLENNRRLAEEKTAKKRAKRLKKKAKLKNKKLKTGQQKLNTEQEKESSDNDSENESESDADAAADADAESNVDQEQNENATLESKEQEITNNETVEGKESEENQDPTAGSNEIDEHSDSKAKISETVTDLQLSSEQTPENTENDKIELKSQDIETDTSVNIIEKVDDL